MSEQANPTLLRYFESVFVPQKIEEGLKPQTINSYRWGLKQFIGVAGEEIRLMDLTEPVFVQCKNALTSKYTFASARNAWRLVLTVLRHWKPDRAIAYGAKAKAVPKYRRERKQNGNEFAIVRINGHNHRLGRYDSLESKARYYRLLAEWEASGRSPTFGLPSHVDTIAELLDGYIQYCSTYYGTGPNSEVHRTDYATRELRGFYGGTPAAKFTPIQFKAIRQSMIDKGLARSYINAQMKRIVRFFRWAASESKITPEIPAALSMVPGLKYGRTAAREAEKILPIDNSIVDATLPHLTPVVADLVRFHRLTGCRPSEACSVRPCDVDRTGDVWTYRPPSHKTLHLGHERVICIGPQAQDVLRPYLSRESDAYCFSPSESEAKRRAMVHAKRATPLSCGNRPGTNRKRRRDIVRAFGDCYDPRSYRKAVFYACEKAGIESWGPNRLRHSAATEIRKRFGLEAAQVVLGHSQANVTQVYAERDHQLAASVAKQVG